MTSTRRNFGLLLLLIITMLVAACGNPEADDQQKVIEQQDIYSQRQPIPSFEWSLDRDTLIQWYRLSNQATNTHTIITAEGSGDILWDCPSKGYPLAADSSLTNPLQRVSDSSGPVALEQAEPNGIYPSKNTKATIILCVRANGDIVPVLNEQDTITFPFAVEVIDGVVVEVPTSPSSATIDVTNRSPVSTPVVTP